MQSVNELCEKGNSLSEVGMYQEVEMSRNVQSGNTQNLKSSAASDQAAVCACAHSRYFTGGSPSGLRV